MTTHQGVPERDVKMLLKCSLLRQKVVGFFTAPVVRIDVKVKAQYSLLIFVVANSKSYILLQN